MRNQFVLSITLLLLIMCIANCTLLPLKLAKYATVSTSPATKISHNSASCAGTIGEDGGANVTTRGLCWDTLPNPTIRLASTIIVGEGKGSFSTTVNNLRPNTTYYVRAWAINKVGVSYGQQVVFLTLLGLPALTTFSPSDITKTTAKSGGIIFDGKGSGIIQSGIVCSHFPNPIIDSNYDFLSTGGNDTGSFYINITNLTPNTTYYVRAWAKNANGCGYGNQEIFSTGKTAPTVSVTPISSISSNSGSCSGTITSDGGSPISQGGVCWSTVHNPTISDNKTHDATDVGVFYSYITALLPNTLYYVRAYASNLFGTSYSTEVSFTTDALPVYLATLTTSGMSSMTGVTALSGGNVTADGGATVTSRGVCWSTSPSPTISLSTRTSDGTGTGSFSSTLTGLASATTYYVRAYATNSVGTAYGNEVVFFNSTTPTVTTNSITGISVSSGSSGGSISNDGGASVTSRGVCWSTSPSPTISLSTRTSDGTGTGVFSSSISGLLNGTTYYVRAYATNSVGTAYGSEISFTTHFAIGQLYGGGTVYYVDGTGIHGLIASYSDQSTSVRWHNGTNYTTGATSTSIGSGSTNTTTIISVQGSGTYAASLCRSYSGGGFHDWYLPSKSELNQLYLQRSRLSGFSTGFYLSSSEYSYDGEWAQSFASGTAAYRVKSSYSCCRAIRAF